MRAIIIAVSCLAIVGCAVQTQPPESSPRRAAKPSVHAKSQLPSANDIVTFKANPPPTRTHFRRFVADREQITTVLDSWYRVSQDHWRHGYSHVAMEDRTGSIKLKDGTIIQWMLKPGGLARLSLPHEETIYLAKELTPWKGDAEQLPRTDSSSRADAGIGTVQE